MGILEYTALELARLKAEIDVLKSENERLSAMAYRDPLTNLRNRRFFTERLAEEMRRAFRRHAVCSVISIDVNGFKRLNDTLGHAAGDAALVAIGRWLETLTRTEDLCCRTGGDEFVVLLPDTTYEQALIVLCRFKDHLASLAHLGLGLPRKCLAFGMASWRPGDDALSLLARADEAMYLDKKSPTLELVAEGLGEAA